MSIQCDCSVDCDEPARCYSDRNIIARKEHVCIECRATIKRGERYKREKGIGFQGDTFSYATCMPCARIRAHYCSNGWIWGDLADTIQECIGWDYREDPPDDEHDPQFDGNVPVREVAA